jgi:hypothetical protein
VVLWVDYPWPQLLIELFFNYVGMDVASLNRFLNPQQRSLLTRQFNQDPEKPKILVCTYRVGAVALNLQHLCHVSIAVEPAVSQQVQEQANHRIRRMGQTRPQTVIYLQQLQSFNGWQLRGHEEKGLAELLAQIRTGCDVEWVVEGTTSEIRVQEARKLFRQRSGWKGAAVLRPRANFVVE